MSDVVGYGSCHPPVATLLRTIPVKLLDVSRGGCRLEVARAVPAGVSGRLTVELEGRLHVDDVRVARCQQRVGGGALYQLGAELLGTRRLHRRSVRLAVERIISEQTRGVGHADGMSPEPLPPETMGRRDEREKAVEPGAAGVGKRRGVLINIPGIRGVRPGKH